MRKILYFSCLLMIGLLFARCNNERVSKESVVGMRSAQPTEMMEDMTLDDVQLQSSYDEDHDIPDRNRQVEKLIKQGQLQFEVKDIQKAKSKVDQVVNDLEGYYEQEQYHAHGNRMRYELKIRVPGKKLDSLVSTLEAHEGKLLMKELSVDDVTSEYIDLNIRLENKIAYLEQYKQLLKKANSIKEILEVQEKIRRLEAEIESKKGRIKYIDDKAAYSSLRVDLLEYQPVVRSHARFLTRIANAFESGFHAFLSFVIVLVNFWPFLIMLGLLLVFRKRFFRMFKRK